MGNYPFTFFRATGKRNTLIRVHGTTPTAIQREGVKKSALYVQLADLLWKTLPT
jgi:hypothetical protein